MWIQKFLFKNRSGNQGIKLCKETKHFSAILKQTIQYSLPADVLRETAGKGELTDTVKVIASVPTVLTLYMTLSVKGKQKPGFTETMTPLNIMKYTGQ